MIDISIPNEMILALKGNPIVKQIFSEALSKWPDAHSNSESSELATAWSVGAMFAVWGVVISAPSNLDRLQEDAFYEGVAWSEELQDNQ